MPGRHAHADDVLRAEGIAGDGGGKRRVDAARHPDQHLLETLLADVVVRAQHDRGVNLGRALERLVECGLDGRLWVGGWTAHHGYLGHLELQPLRAFRLTPDVFGGPVDWGGGVDIADDHLFDKRRRVGEHPSIRIEDHAVAVEDELILAPDGVDPGDVGAIARGAFSDHRLARAALAVVIRRPVDVDEDVRPVVRLPGHRTGREPAVLTHRQADSHAVPLDDRAAVAGLEVPLLIEHAVVRQKDLVVDSFDLAVVQEGGGVEDGPILVDESHDRRDACRRLRDNLQLSEVVADERRLQDQVFGRVAGDSQLRKADDVRAQASSAIHPVDDQAGIALQIADCRIDLRERDPHDLILTIHLARHRGGGPLTI